MNDTEMIFQRLMAVIEERRSHPSDRSYTSSLLAGGVEAIGAKIMEEAGEVVDAARESDPDARKHLIHEAADLMYHLLVMLGHKRVQLVEVEAELAVRFGMSGLDEKASRNDGS
jgi:phosphoribosyl-ATP pyrophosphohydrolase